MPYTLVLGMWVDFLFPVFFCTQGFAGDVVKPRRNPCSSRDCCEPLTQDISVLPFTRAIQLGYGQLDPSLLLFPIGMQC